MDVIDELHELDRRLQQSVRRWFDDSYGFLSGSTVEVGMLCRSLPTKIFEVECDVMIPIGSLTQDMSEKYLVEVQGHPGYYHLRPSPTAEYLNDDDD